MIDHMKIKGEGSTRRVWIDGKELLPGPSQELYNHSPDGFNWSYHGSGPAQLALAILFKLSDNANFALRYYQSFKQDFIASMPEGDFEYDGMIVMDWIESMDGFNKSRHYGLRMYDKVRYPHSKETYKVIGFDTFDNNRCYLETENGHQFPAVCEWCDKI